MQLTGWACKDIDQTKMGLFDHSSRITRQSSEWNAKCAVLILMHPGEVVQPLNLLRPRKNRRMISMASSLSQICSRWSANGPFEMAE